MTFLFTWILWGISYVSHKGFFDGLAGFMPSIMAIIITGYLYGAKGIKKLLKKITIWKVNLFFYAFAFGITATTILISSLICNIIGTPYKIHISSQIYGINLYNPINILIFFLAVMVFGGPLGEEFGWRGFVLPRLQSELQPIFSSVVLAVIWSLWHIPLFFLRSQDYILKGHGFFFSFIFYLVETIWLTILFTWLYNRTGGSLLLPILYHAADNVVLVLFNINEGQFSTFTIILNIVRLIILVVIVFDMKKIKEIY